MCAVCVIIYLYSLCYNSNQGASAFLAQQCLPHEYLMSLSGYKYTGRYCYRGARVSYYSGTGVVGVGRGGTVWWGVGVPGLLVL